MDLKWLFTILFGLLTIWTGLLRGVEAHAYKPNALWFGMTLGLLAIVAGFLYRLAKRRPAALIALVSAGFVLVWYLIEFITKPEGNATYRVAIIIVAAIAEVVVVLLPMRRETRL